MASSTASSSIVSPSALETLTRHTAKLRSQIKAEIDEVDDPLALYDQFVKWTCESYPQEYLAHSGLLEVLEEATRKYKTDESYKCDLRYLKMWTLYANLVDKPIVVFKHIMTKGIGIVYAQLYEEYALMLEREGRHSDADQVYRAGIQRKARPPERLRKRYELFKQRTSSKPPVPPPAPTVRLPRSKGTAEADSLRRNPLKYHNDVKAPSSRRPHPSSQIPSTSASASSSTSPPPPSKPHDPYAAMLAPPPPGKRPEKMQFNMSLLFTEDRAEYSMPEARARSMGLLGKKWGPPPVSELSRNAPIRVNFNDDSKSARPFSAMARKSLLVGEPTVTINTKEALADVFGMYNSPEKSMRFGPMPGSKHAPVRKIEPVTPMNLVPPMRSNANENANMNAKTPTAFKPFVDENAGRKENATPGLAKFKPFVDPEAPKTPAFTPESGRRALSAKDPASMPGSKLRPKGDENTLGSVFTKPAIPAKPERESPVDVFVDEPQAPPSQQEVPVFRSIPEARNQETAAKPTTFVPFTDSQAPFKVFSRPPDENVQSVPAKTGGFRPFVESENPAPPRSALNNRTPLRSFVPTRVHELRDDTVEEEEGEDEDDDYDEDGEHVQVARVAFQEDDTDNGRTPRTAPLGGRFGQFDVMTPITERTFEYTSTSTRLSAMGQDGSSVFDKGFVQSDAVEAAERLAAELRDEENTGSRLAVFTPREPIQTPEVVEEASFDSLGEAEDEDPRSPSDVIEEKTGTLSLSDAIAVASAFAPPNPCNPFDPPIVSTLLSLLPEDAGHHNLVHQESKMLDGLQKFARSRERRASGNTSSRSLDSTGSFPVTLGDHRFAVYEKLGEGGFGAVFAAKDVTSKVAADDSDDSDDDDDEAGRVALKVVKPRNLWEFHVLRKLHGSLPAKLRSSIIKPHALYTFRDESFLILDLCTQGTLLDIINRSAKAGISQQGACLDELLVVFFTIELLRLLEGMHAAGFIHGDLKIDNCLVRLED
ncbi:hypothetical protein EWM64_g1903, partial [Hericium alpestre]